MNNNKDIKNNDILINNIIKYINKNTNIDLKLEYIRDHYFSEYEEKYYNVIKEAVKEYEKEILKAKDNKLMLDIYFASRIGNKNRKCIYYNYFYNMNNGRYTFVYNGSLNIVDKIIKNDKNKYMMNYGIFNKEYEIQKEINYYVQNKIKNILIKVNLI